MISAEENQLLTQTDPGTACGEMMRRYWQPVALCEELPSGGAPLKVKILGEELVLFRDDQGRPGLIGLHCSHRGADLSYGRVEDGGLRCLYHGWLYDVCGRVLHQPGEPGGGANKNAIRHRAHPCQEAGGVIFTYMGPGEPPLLPNYEFLTVPAAQRSVTKIFYECNYLQGNEGNIDPVHLSFLHQYLEEAKPPLQRIVSGADVTDNTLLKRDIAPHIDVEVTDYGLRIYTTRESEPGKTYLRITNFIIPNLSAFGGSTVGEGYAVHWHVPIDDTRHCGRHLLRNENMRAHFGDDPLRLRPILRTALPSGRTQQGFLRALPIDVEEDCESEDEQECERHEELRARATGGSVHRKSGESGPILED